MKIRWIHFSDLHLGNDKATDTRLMRRKLPGYIAGLTQKFDYAFCSGDIKEWNCDYTKADDYLKQLCYASKTPLNHLFLVPGNHDVKRDNEDRTALIGKITDCNTNYYEPDNGCISEEDYRLLKSGETEFIRFVEQLLGSERASAYSKPHFTITTEHFNILHLDSTLTYGTGHEREFIIGTRALMDALDECDPALPTIILTHYSYDFLDMKERDEVEVLLNEYHVQLWLAGHEHENLIREQRGKFWECQCGNLLRQKGARSCFLTGEYDTGSRRGIIAVHAWYEGRDWERFPFARIGSEDDLIFPFALHLPGDEPAADNSAALFNACEACSRLSSPGDLFDNVTINPAILTDLEIGGKVYPNQNGELPLVQVMHDLWSSADASHHALILGDGGMGKSTAMYHACQQLLSSRQLAIYISLQARESAEDESIIDYVLRCLYQTTDEHAHDLFYRLASSRHTDPDLILFIDGFNELTGAGAQRYVAQIKELSRYPGIQIIISSRLDFLRDFGLTRFGMIRTCNLREEQIKVLFKNQPEDWSNIQRHKNLRILVKNPMMALLYANTCPIVQKHMELDYLDWIVPITNASDLLHDYYLSQIALLIDRDKVDGNRIFHSRAAIDFLLSDFAYMMERKNKTVTTEADFDRYISEAVAKVNERFHGELPESLRGIKRKFRLRNTLISHEDIYDLIISEMCLLKSGNHNVSFSHQIYRDYLSAVYLKQCLMDEYCVDQLWRREKIHKGVIEYLRNMGNEAVWGTGGKASQLLAPYRGIEVSDDDRFLENIINCWLSQGNGERDLSSLDLRKVSLTDHLKTKFSGTININNAWVNEQVFINDKCHDRIIAVCFSHDNRTMAAVSCNGIVSITNLVTQSQMIIYEFEPCSQVTVGFDAEDCLIIKNDSGTYKWTTIAYDLIEEGNVDDILTIPLSDAEVSKRVDKLKSLLKKSDLEGVYSSTSENGLYLAIGFESGFIHVWNTVTQDCIAKYSLSDSRIVTASFSKDGKIAALGSGGRLVQIWDVIEGSHQRTLFFDKKVSAVEFSEHDYQLTCQLSDGTYCKADTQTGEITASEKPPKKELISKTLQKKAIQTLSIDIAPHGNAILIDSKKRALTWDEKTKKLSICPGHNGPVSLVAICDADERFAASYSDERYTASRQDGRYRFELNGQKLVRVRIVKTGQCQRRLPTKGRSLTKLQFFTSNRIVLAGFASNGDILLWELINRRVGEKEYGSWNTVEIVRSNQAEPLECAVPADKKTFISAFSDGTIIIRPFANAENTRTIKTYPGIDAEVFRWEQLNTSDDVKKILSGYQ